MIYFERFLSAVGCHGFLRELFERTQKNPDAITLRRDWWW